MGVTFASWFRRRDVRAACVIALAVNSVAAPTSAQPAKPTPSKAAKPKPLADSLSPEARADYQTGKVLFTDGDFAGAQIKFQAAFDKSPDPRLLWNIAACEKNLRHYSKALRLVTRYTKEGGALLSRDDVREATELASALEPLTTQVTITANEPGAEVFLDDEKIGTTPLAEPILVDVGMRHVRVVKNGFRPYDTQIPIGGAKTAAIDVKLEPEGGRLKVNAPPNATVTIDDKAYGQGPQDIALTVGGHVLRATAPGMRTFQTEVTVQDNQTRALDVVLEPEGAAGGGPELRVAVGCDDPRPRSPEEGLSVYLDGSTSAAPPRGVQKRWNDEVKGVVVDYVSYSITPGAHTARVRFPGCDTMDAEVDVVAGRPGEIHGVLRPETSFFSRGPAGYPDWWRASAGLWITTTRFGNFYDLLLHNHDTGSDRPVTFGSTKGDVTSAGPALSIGLVGRWLTFLFDLRYASGKTTGATQGIYDPSGGQPNARPIVGAIDGTSTISTYYAGLRFGGKVPLYYAALSAGPGVAFSVQDIASPTFGHSGEPALYLSGWAALDLQPICDVGLQVMVQEAAVAEAGHPQGNTTFVFAAGYQPNQRCRREQAGVFRLEGSHR